MNHQSRINHISLKETNIHLEQTKADMCVKFERFKASQRECIDSNQQQIKKMFDNLKAQMTNLIQQSTVNQVQRNTNQPLSIHAVSASNHSIASEHSNQNASVQSKQNAHTSSFAFSNPTLLPHLTLALSKLNLFNKTSSVERWWNSFCQRFCLLQWWCSCMSSQCFNCHNFSSVHCQPSKPWSCLWWLWWWSPMASQARRTLSTWNWCKWQNPINTIDSCSTQWNWHSQESLILEDWSFCKNDWKFATCKWWTQWCLHLLWTHCCSLPGLSCWSNICLAFFWRAWTKQNDSSNHSSWNHQPSLPSNCFFVGHFWHLCGWLAEIKQMHFASPFPTGSNVQRHLHFVRQSRDVVSHHVFNDSQAGSQSWWHRSWHQCTWCNQGQVFGSLCVQSSGSAARNCWCWCQHCTKCPSEEAPQNSWLQQQNHDVSCWLCKTIQQILQEQTQCHFCWMSSHRSPQHFDGTRSWSWQCLFANQLQQKKSNSGKESLPTFTQQKLTFTKSSCMSCNIWLWCWCSQWNHQSWKANSFLSSGHHFKQSIWHIWWWWQHILPSSRPILWTRLWEPSSCQSHSIEHKQETVHHLWQQARHLQMLFSLRPQHPTGSQMLHQAISNAFQEHNCQDGQRRWRKRKTWKSWWWQTAQSSNYLHPQTNNQCCDNWSVGILQERMPNTHICTNFCFIGRASCLASSRKREHPKTWWFACECHDRFWWDINTNNFQHQQLFHHDSGLWRRPTEHHPNSSWLWRCIDSIWLWCLWKWCFELLNLLHRHPHTTTLVSVWVDRGANCHVSTNKKWFVHLHLKEINCTLASGEKSCFHGAGATLMEASPFFCLARICTVFWKWWCQHPVTWCSKVAFQHGRSHPWGTWKFDRQTKETSSHCLPHWCHFRPGLHQNPHSSFHREIIHQCWASFCSHNKTTICLQIFSQQSNSQTAATHQSQRHSQWCPSHHHNQWPWSSACHALSHQIWTSKHGLHHKASIRWKDHRNSKTTSWPETWLPNLQDLQISKTSPGSTEGHDWAEERVQDTCWFHHCQCWICPHVQVSPPSVRSQVSPQMGLHHTKQKPSHSENEMAGQTPSFVGTSCIWTQSRRRWSSCQINQFCVHVHWWPGIVSTNHRRSQLWSKWHGWTSHQTNNQNGLFHVSWCWFWRWSLVFFFQLCSVSVKSCLSSHDRWHANCQMAWWKFSNQCSWHAHLWFQGLRPHQTPTQMSTSNKITQRSTPMSLIWNWCWRLAFTCGWLLCWLGKSSISSIDLWPRIKQSPQSTPCRCGWAQRPYS